ncbi:hypothetical protein GE21DRAFT_1356055, partial [Neurospora crassa]
MHQHHLALESCNPLKRAGFTEGIALLDYGSKEIGLTLDVAGETAPEDTDALKAQTTCDQNDMTCGKRVMESFVGFIVFLLAMTPIGTTGS